MYVSVCVHVLLSVCLYDCLYVGMHACLHVCMWVLVHVCVVYKLVGVALRAHPIIQARHMVWMRVMWWRVAEMCVAPHS